MGVAAQALLRAVAHPRVTNVLHFYQLAAAVLSGVAMCLDAWAIMCRQSVTRWQTRQWPARQPSRGQPAGQVRQAQPVPATGQQCYTDYTYGMFEKNQLVAASALLIAPTATQ